MATVTGAIVRVSSFGDKSHVVTWGPLTTTDTYGSPVEMPGSSDRSVQLTGTLSSGGAVTIYGSNIASPNLATDADWAILTDPQGNNLAMSTLKIEAISELTRWIRPKVTGGDGSTSLTVSLLLRRSGS